MNMNENPTIEQLQEFLAQCSPGTLRYLLWVGTDGEVHIDPLFHMMESDLTEIIRLPYSKWQRRFDYSPD